MTVILSAHILYSFSIEKHFSDGTKSGPYQSIELFNGRHAKPHLLMLLRLLRRQTLHRTAASVQQAVIYCLVDKSIRALKQTELKRLCVGRGVATNQRFQIQLQNACDRSRIDLKIAPHELCTDTAVMGTLAWARIDLVDLDDLNLDVKLGLLRQKH